MFLTYLNLNCRNTLFIILFNTITHLETYNTRALITLTFNLGSRVSVKSIVLCALGENDHMGETPMTINLFLETQNMYIVLWPQ